MIEDINLNYGRAEVQRNSASELCFVSHSLPGQYSRVRSSFLAIYGIARITALLAAAVASLLLRVCRITGRGGGMRLLS